MKEHRTRTCKICYIGDNTTWEPDGLSRDLDSDIHQGFTIGKGKTMYWMITWTRNGHCYAYSSDDKTKELTRRWVNGDTEITIHWKD